MFEPGSVIAGKYRVDRLLGHGGMGVVVAAMNLDLRTPVALKFMANAFGREAEVVERFLREARACASLRSEHVCRVFDVGRLDDGTPFLVMELLAGWDLATQLAQGGPLTAPTAADYVIQACHALVEAHRAGIVHRDLKPANLFLAQRAGLPPAIKVLDFGIAKAKGDPHSGTLTRTDNVMGSPSYMAPEHLRSARYADARSDLWSLGITLAELATGERPYDGDSAVDLALKIAASPPRLSPAMHPGLRAIVERCLRIDPAQRFQSAAELRTALEPVASDPSAWPVAPAPARPSAIETTTLASASGVMAAARGSRRIVLGAAMLGALMIAFAITRVVARDDEPEPAAAPPRITDPPGPDSSPAPANAPAPLPPPEPDAALPEPATATPPPVTPVHGEPPAPPVKRTPHRHKTKDEIGASRT